MLLTLSSCEKWTAWGAPAVGIKHDTVSEGKCHMVKKRFPPPATYIQL